MHGDSIEPDSRLSDEQADQLEQACELLREVACTEDETLPSELREFAGLLMQLSELAGICDDISPPDESSSHVSEFILAASEVVKSAADNAPDAADRIGALKAETLDRWGERLDLDASSAAEAVGASAASWQFEQPWDDDPESAEPGDAAADDEASVPSQAAIETLLATLRQSEPTADVEADESTDVGDEPEQFDEELREAFLDDADRCLGAMEEALFLLEANHQDPAPLQQIQRELHTLKGASGTVGLNGLASFIHELEESLRPCDSGQQPPDVAMLFSAVDTIRHNVNSVRAVPPPQQQSARVLSTEDIQPAAFSPQHAFAGDSTEQETVRVKASQLTRLMDMLSQLVMLRNRRGMELADLQAIHHDILHAVSRIRVLGEGPRLPTKSTVQLSVPLSSPSLAVDPSLVHQRFEHDHLPPPPRLQEITNDLLETAQRLRDCYQPVVDGNAAVSQFIRGFRQQLVELQRTPVSGLIRRLRRAIHDAARAEHKQVELIVFGEHTGIEGSLQEKIFEPLLHIVRNCVSHGIESPDERIRRGKDATGRIWLAGHSGPDLLVIEIRDDGRGLDYDAIRRRGIERGLIKPDMAPSRDELAQLIFQAGFSTRDAANELAGRGVGMDVVAATLERIRGWVEVTSEPDAGTTIRLNFPLPSVIQHTMLFRSAGQLFALPMQFVHAAGSDQQEGQSVTFATLIGNQANLSCDRADSPAPAEMLVLDCHAQADPSRGAATTNPQRRLALAVDEIVGPEEVVVRPLPALLKQHPLCSGATLSGMGEVVLVLDAHRLAELGAIKPRVSLSNAMSSVAGPIASRPRVLVADDSRTARERLVRSLERYPVEIVQASNGAEAIELLGSSEFAAVISDIEMPHLDGLQLLAAIKANPGWEQLPVVIASSRTEPEFRQRVTELGARDFIGKPITDNAIDQVAAWLVTRQPMS